METNPRLKLLILQAVDNQLRANDPPETKQTLDRLISEGYSKKEAKELIGYFPIAHSQQTQLSCFLDSF